MSLCRDTPIERLQDSFNESLVSHGAPSIAGSWQAVRTATGKACHQLGPCPKQQAANCGVGSAHRKTSLLWGELLDLDETPSLELTLVQDLASDGLQLVDSSVTSGSRHARPPSARTVRELAPGCQ